MYYVNRSIMNTTTTPKPATKFDLGSAKGTNSHIFNFLVPLIASLIIVTYIIILVIFRRHWGRQRTRCLEKVVDDTRLIGCLVTMCAASHQHLALAKECLCRDSSLTWPTPPDYFTIVF